MEQSKKFTNEKGLCEEVADEERSNGTVDCKPGSGKKCTVQIAQNVDLVGVKKVHRVLSKRLVRLHKRQEFAKRQ